MSVFGALNIILLSIYVTVILFLLDAEVLLLLLFLVFTIEGVTLHV